MRSIKLMFGGVRVKVEAVPSHFEMPNDASGESAQSSSQDSGAESQSDSSSEKKSPNFRVITADDLFNHTPEPEPGSTPQDSPQGETGLVPLNENLPASSDTESLDSLDADHDLLEESSRLAAESLIEEMQQLKQLRDGRQLAREIRLQKTLEISGKANVKFLQTTFRTLNSYERVVELEADFKAKGLVYKRVA